jgi:hypothetical protein
MPAVSSVSVDVIWGDHSGFESPDKTGSGIFAALG